MFSTAAALAALAAENSSTNAPNANRSMTQQPQERAPVEDLPTYSEHPEYTTAPLPQNLTRRVVKDHEKRVKQDLKEAYNTEIQCAKIKQILPQIYEQLTAAVDAPRAARSTTGPAALRTVQEDAGIEISFKSRGIDQKALRDYLPALLADYQRQRAEEDITRDMTDRTRTMAHPLSRAATDSELVHDYQMRPETELGDAQSSRPILQHANTTGIVRHYDPDRMTVKAGYFEEYTQKIYFSKKFADLWRKKNGRRENIASGIAMVLVGVKLGLPLFDLITFVALDVPRLTLQGITGKQKLKLKD